MRIPLLNQDNDRSPPEPVRMLKEKPRRSDALHFGLNEYDFSISAALKKSIG